MSALPESPIIRPPSEWRSLLVRITRGCNWNRCRFCGIYPAMGQADFSIRSLEEICRDIDLLLLRHPRAETAFFGDADPLAAGMEIVVGAARYLRQRRPVQRLTCYGRVATLYRLGPDNIHRLAAAGLDRVHVGLESGDAEILRRQRKGQSPEMVEVVARWLRQAGIELSCYVLLGLGGRDLWQRHITETARLINRIEPDFVRVRRLWLHGHDAETGCPLWKEVRAGTFVEQDPDGTVRELELLLTLLKPMDTLLTCDHANNYIQLSGLLREDRDGMVVAVREFLALPRQRREAVYAAIGSRI